MLNQFDPQHQVLLEGIQGNILKSHGRHHTANLFIRCLTSVDGNQPSGSLRTLARKWLQKLAGEDTGIVQSAYHQLRNNALFKESGGKADTGLFACIHISAAGYRYIFENDAALNAKLVLMDQSFSGGMKARAQYLNDPAFNEWEPGFRGEIHFMLLLAHADPEELGKAVAAVQGDIQHFGVVTVIENGNAIFNDEGAGIEHFGYVDGVSQPLFFDDEWRTYKENHGIFQSDTELKKTGYIKFDPRAEPGLVLTQDVFAEDEQAFGSYFVFRKLEQNVKGFKQAEADLATRLGLEGDDRERAGAMLVGRFEDGTPVEVRGKEELIQGAVFNNFGYDPDEAARCPYHAHIRKTNPRVGPVEDGTQVKNNLAMARRGIPFGTRKDNPNDGIIFTKPDKEVGLLFMSYQASILNQFEAIQRSANDTKKGIDHIIGQGDHTAVGNMSRDWNNPDTMTPVSFSQFVYLKGGEYFFTPSLQFLRGK